jgi:hypothetical protein
LNKRIKLVPKLKQPYVRSPTSLRLQRWQKRNKLVATIVAQLTPLRKR